MGTCDRRASIDPRRGLYAGIALVGIGMSLAVGPGVAFAAPSDSSQSAEASGTPDTSTATGPSDDGYSGASNEGSGSEADEATQPDEGTELTDESEPVDELTDESDPVDEASEVEEADEASEAGTDLEAVTELEEPADWADAGVADTPGDGMPDTDSAQTRAGGETSGESTQATQSVRPAPGGPENSVGHPDVEERDAEEQVVAGAPAAESVAAKPAPAVPALIRTDLAAETATHRAPTLRSLANARPVTVSDIVTDLLTWAGLGRLADGLPTPAAPVPMLVESLWLAVRQVQYTLNNQRPTAEATMSGPGPDGVVNGILTAFDYDDTVLTYRITAAPTHGNVIIDALGNFTYTPDAGGALTGDRFTVTVDDTTGNPFHVHGLLGALGITGATEVTVVIAPAAARRGGPVGADLSDLLSRDGVEVTADSQGAVGVIGGRFTDHLVLTAADAAAVMNSLAPALGYTSGFADPAAIKIANAGVGSSAENFYRLSESIGGIAVLGSELILVTDTEGAVTGLFNNYRGLAEGFDLTPAETVDEAVEVYVVAAADYLGTAAERDALETFLAQNTFTSQLIVHALDGDAEPRLAWRVVVHFPDTGDMSLPGATYLIDAHGVDAGTIIATSSTVSDASMVTVAKDWLGVERSITVDSSNFLFLTSEELVDAARGITTYQSSFPFFGLFGASLPGSVVKRGWFSWDRGAVSAHANTAVVYDYFHDVLGRTSFDGAGAPITVSIRYNPGLPIFGYTNAFWDPTLQQFAYGDSGYLQAALDVVAHEFTHGVVSHVVGDGGSVLDYGESGALNEAMADIFGALIEGKSGADRWLLAEDSGYGVIRNLADPTSVPSQWGPHRDHYDTRYTGSGDEGGEHINSTIFSHAAYTMMTAAATSDISDETWATLFYQSLFRLSPGAVFVDGRAAVLSAAAALDFTADQLDAIRAAFDSVGILGVEAAVGIAA